MTSRDDIPDLDLAEKNAQALGKLIGGSMPEGYGFALFIFTYGEGGGMTYIASAEREDMLKALKEFIAKEEAGMITPPGEPFVSEH